MTKDGKRECPDCAGPDLSALFGGRGDGRCSNCKGEGKITDIGDVIPGMLGFDNFHDCEKCNRTGQCQTCGGTGYEYYNDDYEEEQFDEKEESLSSYDSSYPSTDNSYSSYDSYESNQPSVQEKSSDGIEVNTKIIRQIIKIIWIIFFTGWLSFKLVLICQSYANSSGVRVSLVGKDTSLPL